MSAIMYLSRTRETRMPDAAMQADPLNIKWKGAVLEGRRSLEVALMLNEVQARVP